MGPYIYDALMMAESKKGSYMEPVEVDNLDFIYEVFGPTSKSMLTMAAVMANEGGFLLERKLYLMRIPEEVTLDDYIKGMELAKELGLIDVCMPLLKNKIWQGKLLEKAVELNVRMVLDLSIEDYNSEQGMSNNDS